MNNRNPQLIVALDVDTFDKARGLIDQLKDDVDIFKVGSQIFTVCGHDIIHYLRKAGKRVFLDLKFHDIPNTVANAVREAVKLNIFMCTLHICGGEQMLKAAVATATQTAGEIKVTRPLLVGITVLTSEQKQDNIHDLVLQKAGLAKACGLDGIVSSAQEAPLIRKETGDDFIIVTPGIRPKGSGTHDQQRITTPVQAVQNGSNFLVVGRPVIEAAHPLDAAKAILREIQETGIR